MQKNISIPLELLACLIEINSDLGFLLNEGIDGDVLENMVALQERADILIGMIGDATTSDRRKRA